MSGHLVLTARYALFALIAMGVNLGTQMLVMAWPTGGLAIPASVVAGTATGLVVKYLLDQHYIFAFVPANRAHQGRLFLLYSFLGLSTTAMFWGTEFLFNQAFGTDQMRYLGGAIGLALGYLVKYQLDKRFVFVAHARSLGPVKSGAV